MKHLSTTLRAALFGPWARARGPALAAVLVASRVLAAAPGAAPQDPRADVQRWLESGDDVPRSWGEDELGALFSLLGAGSPDAERVLAGMLALRPAALPRWVDARVDPGSPLERRLAALFVHGRAGDRGSIPRCLELAGEPSEAALAGPTLRQAVAAILRRRPEAQSHLWAVLGDVPEHLRPFVYAAVADAPSRTGLAELVARLDHERAARPDVLDAIARIAGALPPPFGEEVRAAVRPWLDAEEPALRSSAAQASGALEDPQAVPRLVELLTDGEPRVRRSSHDALRRVSGQRFRSHPDRWRSWYATERRWWDEQSERVFRDLLEGPPVQAIAAIASIAARSLDRHRLAARLVSALERDDVGVRRLAALGLAQLGSPVGLDALRAACDDESEEVRLAASDALAVLVATRSDPPDPRH